MGRCKYYYQYLTDDQKRIYSLLIKGAANLNKKILLTGYVYINNKKAMNDVHIAMEAALFDYPELFYLKKEYIISTITNGNNTEVQLNVTYTVGSRSQLNEQIAAIKKAMSKILSQVTATDPFNIEVHIHDILAKEIEYYRPENESNIPDNCYNIYGALVEKKAVCEGFAKSFCALMRNKKIDTTVVIGNLSDVPHIWNIVKMPDGWYHVDVTNDQLCKEGGTLPIHPYFNITTAQISKTHHIKCMEKVPEANSEKYNYYYATGRIIKKSDRLFEGIKKVVSINKSSKVLEFKTEGLGDKFINTLNMLQGCISKMRLPFTQYYNILDTHVFA